MSKTPNMHNTELQGIQWGPFIISIVTDAVRAMLKESCKRNYMYAGEMVIASQS
jgi:hypothetical protein